MPPDGLLPGRYRRISPYIYSDAEIVLIVEQAAQLRSKRGVRALTYSTLFGLLAATGLRLSGSLALDRDDVDLGSGMLAVRRAKFGKSRFVPLHGVGRRLADELCNQPTNLTASSPPWLTSSRTAASSCPS